MQKFEPPDTHHFSAAIGWLELGNAAEAQVELARLSPGLQDHPDVLETRWLISAEQKRWEEGLQAAEALVRSSPKRSSGWLHRAYALRRVPGGGVQKAWEALLPASEKFPKEPIIPYNLACYACQLQKMDDALTWLKRAIEIGGKERMKQMALEDIDLKELRREIQDL
jgi:predicted Zn-dependent protease